jgi:hypothetical protein
MPKRGGAAREIEFRDAALSVLRHITARNPDKMGFRINLFSTLATHKRAGTLFPGKES